MPSWVTGMATVSGSSISAKMGRKQGAETTFPDGKGRNLLTIVPLRSMPRL